MLIASLSLVGEPGGVALPPSRLMACPPAVVGLYGALVDQAAVAEGVVDRPGLAVDGDVRADGQHPVAGSRRAVGVRLSM